MGMDTQPPPNLPVPTVWRYADVAGFYRRSRRTVERWLEAGTAPPYYRDPSGQPYWFEHEVIAFASCGDLVTPIRSAGADDRLEQLRRAAARRRVS